MADRFRIEFLYTGGTIGMVESPRGFEPGADAQAAVTRVLVASGLDLDSVFSEVDRIVDSSNITPAWQVMADHLRRRREEFDRFVVLHGTNTLAHSAAAVSFMLAGFGKPVVFTDSQIPRGLPGPDEPTNILGAPEEVTSGVSRGVTVFFGGDSFEDARVTRSSATELRAFTSRNAAKLSRRAAAVHTPASSPGWWGWDDPLPYGTHDIDAVTAVPRLSASRFRSISTPAPDAVIFGKYGGPSEEQGLFEAVRELVASGTPVVVVSQSPQVRIGMTKCAAGVPHLAGAVGAEDMTFEAVHAKLTFLLGQGCRRTSWAGGS